MGIETAALLGAGGAALGGYFQGQAAKSAASTSAAAQRYAADQAAEAQKFRPVGITSNFGTSNFEFSPEGYLTGAGYTLDPRLQAVQGGLLGGLPQAQQDVANIQAMGRQYMAQSPQEAAQQWMANQQALLNPSRQQAQAQLNNNLFTKGTGGLSVAQGGGLGMANPQQQALANAQAMQDLQLAAQAQQAGQQQYTFGQGLLSSAYQPYTANLSAAGATEALGQQPFELSASLAGRSAAAGKNAADYIKASEAYSPTGNLLSGLAKNTQFAEWAGSSLKDLFSSGPERLA